MIYRRQRVRVYRVIVRREVAVVDVTAPSDEIARLIALKECDAGRAKFTLHSTFTSGAHSPTVINSVPAGGEGALP